MSTMEELTTPHQLNFCPGCGDISIWAAFRQAAVKAGWDVSSAENGRIGLDKVVEKQPDLILLDLMMPEMDGFEFVTRLREQDNWRNIPVIVLTAKDITNTDRMKLDDYVQTVFQKDVYNQDNLLKEIKNLLNYSSP